MKTWLLHLGFIISFLLLGLYNLFAQVNVDTSRIISDIKTLNTYTLHDYSGNDFTAGIRTHSIPLNLLNNNSSISGLGDALQNMGGIYMRNYGNGMFSGITIRGFGPDRTSVLWNGIPINNAGLGLSDINLMPGGFFNLIKLTEGSSSTQFGNGAQGGSLSLEFKPNFTNKFNMLLQQEFGSFFTWNTSAQLNYGNSWFQGRTAFMRNSSNNNYTYKDKTSAGFPLRETVNANFFSYQVMQDLFFKFKHNWDLTFHGWFTYTDRRIPPAMGASNNNAQQFDENIRIMTTLRKTIRYHGIKLQLAYLQDLLNYQTDAFKDSSLIHSGQAQVQYIYSRNNFFALMSGGNFSVNYSEYQYYNTPITELRGNVFVMANFNFRAISIGKFRGGSPAQKKFSVGIRQQFSTNYISYPSAHIGMDWSKKLGKGHQIFISNAVNTAYRMPTLNDLYWVPGGNPLLKPEYSWNIETAFKYEVELPFSKLTVNLLGYFGRTANWIQWVPTPLGYWAPQNITQVQSAGFEGGTNLSVEKKKWNFNFGAKYNFTHTTDINNNFNQLIYVPQHSIKGTFELKWNEIYINLQPIFYSQRYTLTDNTQSIPACFLMNMQAGYKLKLKPCDIGFFGRIGNVTNSDYQMILNRPMPGIHFNIGINFYLNTKTTKQNEQ